MIATPYGEWPSPVSAADVASAGVAPGFAMATADAVWWQEGRPAEGGRTTVVRDGEDLLPPPWNARNQVHEYGGRSYLPLPDGRFVFANLADQRLYLSDLSPLTPENGDRYADLALAPGGEAIWCVRERHADGAIHRAIVSVTLAGAVRELVTGADFFAFPTPSPDGRRLAWISWDHPRMPWDGTELRIAAVPGPDDPPLRIQDLPSRIGGSHESAHAESVLAQSVAAQSVAAQSVPAQSVLAPLWRDDENIYVISDISGWWNLYLCPVAGGEPRPICPRAEEWAGPLWQLGWRPFAQLADGRLAVVHGRGEQRLAVLDADSGELTELDLPYRAFPNGITAAGTTIAAVAAGPADPLSVIAVDADGGRARVLRGTSAPVSGTEWLPEPVALTITRDGNPVHALLYPPTSPSVRGPSGELPPYIVWVHGGPTDHALPALDASKAFFTSRGIGIVDLNYGGSSGYGRQYRDRLVGEWGAVDVDDAYAIAEALVEAGQADPARIGIRGKSAGGWTALAAVTSGLRKPRKVGFAAAVSWYGISDLRALATQTHDFESRYLTGLIGDLPAADPVYAERSPIGHVTPATPPVLLLQGLEDPVVPPAQSEAIARELADAGVPHEYIPFEGESHGFRRAENVAAALRAELAFYGRVMSFAPAP
jgi:dipeptidyl aminopeptidase/acylaminoacyl peptidase